jgi:hypothetical protein
MYQISNTDYATMLRTLRAFCETKGTTIREQEDRRKAALLRRKLERKNRID